MNRFHKEGEGTGMNTHKQDDIQLVIITGMSGA
ncbi:RNase adapter RapZ, partial [Bacillus altitudinis]|nr:RNase adapter RapZ [Bacillus altitudinis]